MKIKKFFVDNKDKIKKLFQFLFCVFGILFYTISIFACGYNVKTALDDTNKKELVNRNEANRGSLGATDFGSIIIGEILSDVNESQIKYFVNFLNIELYDYSNPITQKIDFELEFETKSYFQLYKSYTQYVESVPIYRTFSINFDIPFSDYYIGNRVNKISIGTEDFECQILDISLDDIETFNVNIFYQIAFYIYVDTAEGDVLFEDYYNYTIQTETSVSVYDKTASYYVNYLSSLMDESTTRYIPNKLIYFNLYDSGYDSGYQNGYSDATKDQEDYYEELIIPSVKIEYEEIGYDKGYDVGFDEGKDVGFDEGKDVGYEEGYDVGFDEGKDVGFDEGKDVGYEEGFTDGKFENNAILKPFELMSKGVEPVIILLSSEIAPGITVGTIALIPLAVSMIVFLLKGLVL